MPDIAIHFLYIGLFSISFFVPDRYKRFGLRINGRVWTLNVQYTLFFLSLVIAISLGVFLLRTGRAHPSP